MAQGMDATVEQMLATLYILIGNVEQLTVKILARREENANTKEFPTRSNERIVAKELWAARR